MNRKSLTFLVITEIFHLNASTILPLVGRIHEHPRGILTKKMVYEFKSIYEVHEGV